MRFSYISLVPCSITLQSSAIDHDGSSASSSGGGALHRHLQKHQRHHHHGSDDEGSSHSGSNSSSVSNRHNKPNVKTKQQHDLENIDEEHGYDHYEMNSLLPGKGGGGGGSHPKSSPKKHAHSLKYKHKSSSDLPFGDGRRSSVDSGDDNDADNTKNSSSHDVRSKALFFKTAFWIACWYGTSLATLFLNKIILSRPGSSVHVLGMCQMTTAAVLGGWSAFGGAEYIQRGFAFLFRCLPERARCRLVGMGLGVPGDGSGSGSGGGGNRPSGSEGGAGGAHESESGTPSKAGTSGVNFNFVRDMSIVGVLRGLTVVLGLIALEHVPVSFVETIKATAPAFTVVFARLILKERTATPVMMTLVPVVAGLVLCSASELRFDAIGFVAAVMNNCADCVQNVMSKRMLAHLKPTQLQFYTSVAALALQTPFVLRDATGLIRRHWAHHGDDADVLAGAAPMDTNTEDDHLSEEGPALHHYGMSLTQLLVIDAIFYHLQSVSAYCTMGCMSPVSQSVANTLKRALLVWASILYFGNPVTNSGIVGIIMVVSGVFLYNHFRRLYQ